MSTSTPISKPPTVTEPLAAAALRLNCSTRTLRRRISDGSLTGYRFGPRLIRVSVAEVDALLCPVPTTLAS